jgi:large subunit ribosomal protein L18e
MANAEKQNIKEWLTMTQEASRGSHYPALYKRINKLLSVPSRTRGAVSIYKINSNTKEGDNVIVPRKVLSTGTIDHKVNIAALEYSGKSLQMLKKSGCNVVSIKEMIGKQKINLII